MRWLNIWRKPSKRGTHHGRRSRQAAVLASAQADVRGAAGEGFRAWTDPEALKQWFGPVGYKADVLEMDLRAGGRYRIGFRQNANSETESHVSGEFQDVVPPERLRYTWVWEEQEGFPDTVVSVEFLETAERKPK